MPKAESIRDVFAKTDWSLLAKQKLVLLNVAGRFPDLDGLVNFLDAVQDAAAADGFPVVWLDGKGDN